MPGRGPFRVGRRGPPVLHDQLATVKLRRESRWRKLPEIVVHQPSALRSVPGVVKSDAAPRCAHRTAGRLGAGAPAAMGQEVGVRGRQKRNQLQDHPGGGALLHQLAVGEPATGGVVSQRDRRASPGAAHIRQHHQLLRIEVPPDRGQIPVGVAVGRRRQRQSSGPVLRSVSRGDRSGL